MESVLSSGPGIHPARRPQPRRGDRLLHRHLTWLSLIRARAASLGLVAALGFVTIVSLLASAALSALGQELAMRTPAGNFILTVLNTCLSLAVFALLFAAIYKVLPDTPLLMNKAIIVTAALLLASPALAQTSGATKYAPGQQMHKATKSTAPGASEYAPGHQKNTAAGPGHSESAPGKRSQTTTGMATKKKY